MKTQYVKKPLFGLATVSTLFLLAHQAMAYEMPIGIPEPEFGIKETHEMYAGQFYEAGGFDYRDAGNGPYTHYVDNTHPNCDNANANGYGTVEEPLCTVASADLPAGSVMEIHGGPYLFSSDWVRMTMRGTADNPVFVRGVGVGNERVRFAHNRTSQQTADIRLEGQYYVLETLDFYGGVIPQIRDDLSDLPGKPHHIAFRQLEVQGDPNKASSDASSALSSRSADHVVIYDNHIHHNVKVREGQVVDFHATAAMATSKHVWILNNHIHHNSGDGFQACHVSGLSSPCLNNPPENIYIGGNLMHEDRENAIDLKTIRNVVISQNNMYGYGNSTTSQGDAVAIGTNGFGAGADTTGAGPQNVWVLFNEVSDSFQGMRVEGVSDATFIGNYVHDIENFAFSKDQKQGSVGSIRLINNTVTKNGEGFQRQNSNESCTVEIELSNNLLYDNTSHYNAVRCGTPGETANNIFNNNLHWQSADLGNAEYTGSGSTAADPMIEFIDANADAGIGNQALLTLGSAAIDQATEHVAYQEFEDSFGLDIRYDFNGNKRPAGGAWDIGAFEYGAESGDFDPEKLLVTINYPTKNPSYTYDSSVNTIEFGGHASYEDETITVDWLIAQCVSDCATEIQNGGGDSQISGSTETWRSSEYPVNNWHINEQPLFAGRNVLIVTVNHPNGEQKVTSLILESDQIIAPDVQAPVILVTSPAADNGVITLSDNQALTLSGQVSDNVALNEMTWSCANGCASSGTININTGRFDSLWELIVDDLQYGENSIVLTADDTSGNSASLTLSIQVDEPIDETVIDVNDYELSSYGGSQDNPSLGSVVVEDGGATIAMSGNRWQSLNRSYTVTANTILEFTFSSTEEGEIHGVGFDNSNKLSRNIFFQVYGTQSWGNRSYTYTGNGAPQTFMIPVGEHFTGDFNRLVFANDDDTTAASSNSRFSNIRLYEKTPIDDTEAPELAITAATISFSGSTSDNVAVASVTWSCQSGCTGNGSANISGNAWQVNQVPLSRGSNTIRVEASDATGNRSVEELVITR